MMAELADKVEGLTPPPPRPAAVAAASAIAAAAQSISDDAEEDSGTEFEEPWRRGEFVMYGGDCESERENCVSED
jgi:hypothetical protein